ncbi:hypothetical protein [Shewanella algae]|uniref:hypothetical protein n=1 Tax=Shewanella algae TaxID=38313 RepID=UPI001AAD72E4|nr:hypothetical protein [Shewanella algae]MBO2626650.1 hypothetical protein [Shewanella algae]MBO2661203.1 hypothetical protein [Shewanella algae]MCL1054016.1 hypothetical protein [Shewanella algae]
MRKEDLPIIARTALKHILHRHGEVIYSSHETLAKGDIYLMGLNPGGKPFITIGEHIDRMLTRTKNSYLDEFWKDQSDEAVVLTDEQREPLQKRVVRLLADLGYDARNVCASNLIFPTTRSAEGLCFGLAGLCWPVHEAVLEIVQPKLLLTFGNGPESPYAFVKELLCTNGKEQTIDSDHLGWVCKGFRTELNQRNLFVAGLPHLSRYNSIGKARVVQWLREEMDLVC